MLSSGKTLKSTLKDFLNRSLICRLQALSPERVLEKYLVDYLQDTADISNPAHGMQFRIKNFHEI